MDSPSSSRRAKDAGAPGSGASRTRRQLPTPRVPRAPHAQSLFLDVDGTLLRIAEHPDGVRVTPEVITLLGALNARLDGALALISGRAVRDLDRLFAPLRLCAAGVHGLERRGADGVLHHTAAADRLDALRAPLKAFAEARPGLLLEDKQRALALHYRGAPDRAAECRDFVMQLLDRGAGQLELQEGKMVLELRPGGADKGTAIEAFMAESPFLGRTPVFIGDDVTDEDGFAAVNRLGGLSICVGDGDASAAAFRLSDEDSVIAWLQAWINAQPERTPQ